MRWMMLALWALATCACTTPTEDMWDSSGLLDQGTAPDVDRPRDGGDVDRGVMRDGGPLVRLNRLQVKGYHRSNWRDEDPERDPEYQGHARPPLGLQVTDDAARIFHFGFSSPYRSRSPTSLAVSHWGGNYIRNQFDDGDCVDVYLGFDAGQSLCLGSIQWCFDSVSDGSPDFEGSREPGALGGLARLPTERHAPVFFLIEPQYGMWSDELLACYSEEEQILRAIDPTYMTDRLEYFPAEIFSERVFKPSEVRGDAATLRDAIRGRDGWPTMDRLWGRYIFILYDRGAVRDGYRRGIHLDNEGLEWSADDPHYFVIADDPEEPDAAFFSVPAAETERIRDLVDQGFMVHAHSLDPAEIEAARAAGAHLLTTLEIGDIGFDGPAVCNPATTADEACDPADFSGPPRVEVP